MDNNSMDLGDKIQQSVEASTNWIDNLVNDIHTGAVTSTKYAAGSPEYQQRLNERARLQAQRQQQLQERTKLQEAMSRKIARVPVGTNTFRAIGASFGLLFTAAFISVGFENLFVDPTESVISFIFAGLVGWLSVTRFMKNARYKRYVKYVNIIGVQDVVSIAEIEAVTGYDHKKVIKDIRGMISAGILKQGHLDPKEELLILTNDEYQSFMQNQKTYSAEEALKELREAEEKAKAAKANGDRDPEVVAALEQGANYIKQIRTANEQIPGEEISKKIARLEQVTAQIFAAVDKHPEKLPEIRKFMDYYMPTTLKLLNSYHEFDIQSVQGDNIVKAKQEIEETLDMINMAFENLSDRLYEVDTMDVSADISVLKTLLAQEGLKGDDFKMQ